MGTYFGHEEVSAEEKTEKVNAVFTNVSKYYRFMNDVMCVGTHHIWRRNAILSLECMPGDCVLDLACGTGDCGEMIIEEIPGGKLFCVDANEQMLNECKAKIKSPLASFLHIEAEKLPKIEPKLDKAIICFGIRNFTDPKLALERVIDNMRYGARIVILEFNPPMSSSIPSAYNQYIKNVLPRLGKKLTGDEYSYNYLAESIQREPTPEERRNLLESAGFSMVNYQPLSLGILGLFVAYKH
jgi:demethylmenaquinone methyltransferase/2-methoxy-6-polyprenyl-1,4-benzoquinol methylase